MLNTTVNLVTATGAFSNAQYPYSELQLSFHWFPLFCDCCCLLRCCNFHIEVQGFNIATLPHTYGFEHFYSIQQWDNCHWISSYHYDMLIISSSSCGFLCFNLFIWVLLKLNAYIFCQNQYVLLTCSIFSYEQLALVYPFPSFSLRLFLLFWIVAFRFKMFFLTFLSKGQYFYSEF